MRRMVDTSVWIRALAGREPYASQVEPLALSEGTVRHDLVYGELMIGDTGGRAGLLATYARLWNPHSLCPTTKRFHWLGAGGQTPVVVSRSSAG
jgi:hypothetical protein